uniref:Uncharacterized protein n=1 Tax=Magallana gigas TaxID=29159 RepID=A0A8W8MR75_MAGGI
MISAGIFVLFIVIPSETCIWIPTVEQQDFCSAQYVFGADILDRSSENEMYGFVYNIRVTDVYRVRFNYIAVQTNNADFQLDPPTTDQCNVPSKYCPGSFYCKRNSAGACVVGNHGNCY